MTRETLADKRLQRRWQLEEFIDIYEEKSNDFMGCLVDITDGGMRVLSEREFATGRIFRFWMVLVSEKINFKAKVQWHQKIQNLNVYYSGFRFLDTSPTLTGDIHHLIDRHKNF